MGQTAAALLDRLPPTAPLAWVRGDTGLVGWGVAAQVELSGPDHFAAAQAWWTAGSQARLGRRRVRGAAGSGRSRSRRSRSTPSGPRRWSSCPGPARPPRRADVAHRVGEPDADPLAALTPVPAPSRPARSPGRRARCPRCSGRPPYGRPWTRSSRGDLDKVVLARDLVATAAAPVDQRLLLRRLAEQYPSCWTFAVDGLVGATPELLVRRTGDTVLSRVLAGTVGRLGDDAADGELADALLGSEKDLEEHEHAVHSVAAVLAAALRPAGRARAADRPAAAQRAAPRDRRERHHRRRQRRARPRRRAAPDGGRLRDADRGGDASHPRPRGHGPRPLRRAGRLDGRGRRRRVRHRAALRRGRRGRGCGCSPAAGSWPAPTRTPSWPRPRRSSSRSATRSSPRTRAHRRRATRARARGTARRRPRARRRSSSTPTTSTSGGCS